MSLTNVISGAAAPSASEGFAPSTPEGKTLSEIASGTKDVPFDFDAANEPESTEEDASEEPDSAEEDASEEPDSAEEDASEEPESEDPLVEAAKEAVETPGAFTDFSKNPDAKIKIGGKVLTVKEVEDGLLMRADYTKKTTQIAEERKRHEDFRYKHEEYEVTVKDALEPFGDARTAMFELESQLPDVWDEMVELVIDRYAGWHDMSESERRKAEELHKRDVSEYAAKRARGRAAKLHGLKEKHTKTAELSKNYQTWRGESMRAVGLDPDREEHFELVMDRMLARHRGTAWTKEMFDAESAKVAKTLGVKPPKPAKEEKPKAAPGKADMPPSPRAGGNKRPAASSGGGSRPKTKPKDTASVFADVRSRFNIR